MGQLDMKYEILFASGRPENLISSLTCDKRALTSGAPPSKTLTIAEIPNGPCP